MTRQTLIENYPHRVGGHCGSAAMRDLLHWQGLGWEEPPDEGLVFTLGGHLACPTCARATSSRRFIW